MSAKAPVQNISPLYTHEPYHTGKIGCDHPTTRFSRSWLLTLKNLACQSAAQYVLDHWMTWYNRINDINGRSSLFSQRSFSLRFELKTEHRKKRSRQKNAGQV
ncbi:hypothetical protein [Paenibacillus sp. IHB B 3084]|uniref:hypothetical protein n=1 Tax=Paenibacillus sp. IHB B 3084 TaxID=867076 RepID=UPI0010722F6B|nr:hypothetical protein [Paenibacillus sp. IHB B 3084]